MATYQIDDEEIEKMKRFIKRDKERLETYKDKKNLTEYGGYSKGYLAARISMREDFLDMLGVDHE